MKIERNEYSMPQAELVCGVVSVPMASSDATGMELGDLTEVEEQW